MNFIHILKTIGVEPFSSSDEFRFRLEISRSVGANVFQEATSLPNLAAQPQQ